MSGPKSAQLAGSRAGTCTLARLLEGRCPFLCHVYLLV